MKNPIRQLHSSLFAALLLFSFQAFGAGGQQKTITGEFMDTWCYTSQIWAYRNRCYENDSGEFSTHKVWPGLFRSTWIKSD